MAGFAARLSCHRQQQQSASSTCQDSLKQEQWKPFINLMFLKHFMELSSFVINLWRNNLEIVTVFLPVQ